MNSGEIPDSAITASSSFDPSSVGPASARFVKPLNAVTADVFAGFFTFSFSLSFPWLPSGPSNPAEGFEGALLSPQRGKRKAGARTPPHTLLQALNTPKCVCSLFLLHLKEM